MDFEKLMQEFLDWLRQAAPKLLGAVIILVVGWYLASLVSSLLRKAMQRGRADGGIVSFVYSLTKIALRIIVFISVASQLGVNVNSLIAAIGAAGVTAGLALKDSLSNLASGALIIINKPFHVGDYLETEGLQGTVSRIEIMYTTLVTFDNKEVIIPNARLTANNVTNFTAAEDAPAGPELYRQLPGRSFAGQGAARRAGRAQSARPEGPRPHYRRDRASGKRRLRGRQGVVRPARITGPFTLKCRKR